MARVLQYLILLFVTCWSIEPGFGEPSPLMSAGAGKSPADAIYEACLLRFRPIMMTTLAALLGALPLAVGMGVGSELRRPLGLAIVGGLLVSQVLTLYTTPVVYLYLDRLRLRFLRNRAASLHPAA